MELTAFGEFLSKTFHFNDKELDEKRKRVMAFEIILWTILGGVLYCILYAVMEEFEAALITIIYILFSLSNIYYYFLSNNYKNFRAIQLIAILLMPITEQFIQGGYTDSGAVGMSAFFAPLGALIFLDLKNARKIFYAFVILFVSISIYEWFLEDQVYQVSRKFSVTIFTFVSIVTLSIVYFVLESFVSKINQYQEELKIEKEKSESLLLNILPASVAKELKESGWAKAKGFASATVVFTDFVKFTQSARLLTPGNLVEHLDVYFRAFDNIMEKYGLEKIKTIGDAYLFASGIPEEKHTHAYDAVLAALDIQKEVDLIAKSDILTIPFKLRLGIHSGPLVAGVVGSKKFVYDIWGDTVNIAARIEQNGIAGKVLISEFTHRLVGDKFNCKAEGMINAKNMGEIEIFSVEPI